MTPEEKVTPSVLIVKLLDEISLRLADLNDLITEQRPEGVKDEMAVTVADELEAMMLQKEKPWISFVLYNDGPNPVYVEVNGYPTRTTSPINKGEKLEVDMGWPVIKKIGLGVASSGQSASVRVHALR